MSRFIRLLSGLVLLLSFEISAQQVQTTTTTNPPVHNQSAPKVTSVAPTAAQPVILSNNHHYTNSSGNLVHSPAKASSLPAGASAVCVDGTYSFSQHRQGTCSHHGGVSRWL